MKSKVNMENAVLPTEDDPDYKELKHKLSQERSGCNILSSYGCQ